MQKDLTTIVKIFYSVVAKGIGVVFVTSMLFLSLAVVGTPLAHAASSVPSSSCAVTRVQLHGSKAPTVTCLVKQQASVAKPNITPLPRCTGYYNFFMWYNNGNSVVCFSGAGYTSSGQLGVPGFYNVTWIATNCSAGWIRAYNPGGSYPSWDDIQRSWNGALPPYGDVTQIDVTATYC